MRQGDPLSPLFFCITEDVLSRGIAKLVNCRILLPIASPRGCVADSHVFDADDIIVFCKAHFRGILALMKLMEDYGEASCQEVSKNKCSILLESTYQRIESK